MAGNDKECVTVIVSIWFGFDSTEDIDDDVDEVDKEDEDARADFFGGRFTNNTVESVPRGNADEELSGILTKTLQDLHELHCSRTGISVSSTYGIF